MSPVRVEAHAPDGTIHQLGEFAVDEAVTSAADWLTPRCYSRLQAIGIANLLHVLPVGAWSPGARTDAAAVRLTFGSLL